MQGRVRAPGGEFGSDVEPVAGIEPDRIRPRAGYRVGEFGDGAGCDAETEGGGGAGKGDRNGAGAVFEIVGRLLRGAAGDAVVDALADRPGLAGDGAETVVLFRDAGVDRAVGDAVVGMRYQRRLEIGSAQGLFGEFPPCRFVGDGKCRVLDRLVVHGSSPAGRPGMPACRGRTSPRS